METLLRSKEMSDFIPCEKDVAILPKVVFHCINILENYQCSFQDERY